MTDQQQDPAPWADLAEHERLGALVAAAYGGALEQRDHALDLLEKALDRVAELAAVVIETTSWAKDRDRAEQARDWVVATKTHLEQLWTVDSSPSPDEKEGQ